MQGVVSLFRKEEVATQDAELALIEAARADPAHFGTLYQTYYTRIYQYLRTRVKSNEDAADLTQQVFLKALAALPGYQPRQVPFAAWLVCIARNTAIDLSRRKVCTVSWDFLPALMQPLGQDPAEIAVQREEFVRLGQLINELDPYKRELLALRFAAGLNAAQIAAVVGKSHASVQKHLKRTLHIMKENFSHV